MGEPGATWTDEEVVEHLRSSWGLSGSTTVAAYLSYCSDHPSAPQYLSVTARFGSWGAALARAGLDLSRHAARRSVEFSDGEMSTMLLLCADSLDRPPSIAEYEAWRADMRGVGVKAPCSAIVRRRLGGWPAALEAAGLASKD